MLLETRRVRAVVLGSSFLASVAFGASEVVLAQQPPGGGTPARPVTSPGPTAPGCAYETPVVPPTGAVAFAEPTSVASSGGELAHRLSLRYAENVVAGCHVKLRSYDGRVTGQTLRVRPGDTLHITLANELPSAPKPEMKSMSSMHGDVNTTNLHTHGLHVSPVGNQDNPMLEIRPGTTYAYAIHIPKNHSPGTFWYHAHVHGSTAMQISSGVAGALIVEGGLDDVPVIKAAKERVLVIQQLSYDRSGTLENFEEAFSPGAWERSHRATTINGQLAPTIEMRPGQIERWRIVHAGTRENVSLHLEGHPLNEIAADGVALGRMVTWTDPMLVSPGNRSDLLVQARALPPGTTERSYDLVDESLPATTTLQGQQGALAAAMMSQGKLSIAGALAAYPAKPRQVLAHIVVRGAPMAMSLPTDAMLAGLAPYEDIGDAELTGPVQHVTFDVNFAKCDATGACVPGCRYPEPGCIVAYTIDGREYNPEHRRILRVGQAAEWKLDSKLAIHPFHIHVNNFQVERPEPDGKLHWVWRDTVLVSAGKPTRTLRMRYADFAGTTVLHCHILDHEDQGMMETIVFQK